MINKKYPSVRILGDSAEPKSIYEMREYGTT